MLQSAKNLTQSDYNMFWTISAMLDKTNELMSQFRVVKKQVDSVTWSLLLVPEADMQTDGDKWKTVHLPSR